MHIRHPRIRLSIAAAALLAGGLVALAQPRGPASRPARPPELTVGQAAPDFELNRLAVRKDADGNEAPQVSPEKIKLSAFKGKKPVCLIFSSYT